jgi:hypothetical protein
MSYIIIYLTLGTIYALRALFLLEQEPLFQQDMEENPIFVLNLIIWCVLTICLFPLFIIYEIWYELSQK